MNAADTITTAAININTHEAYQRYGYEPCIIREVVDWAIADLVALGAAGHWVELPDVIAGLAGQLELRGVELRHLAANPYLGHPMYEVRI